MIKLYSTLILILIIAGCSSSRYGNLPRTETPARAKISSGQKANRTTPLQNNKPGKGLDAATIPLLPGTSIVNNKSNDILPTGIEKNKIVYPGVPPLFISPEDSIEINIKEEKKKAEKFSMIGFILGVLSVLFFPLAFMGIVYSAIAYYKMKTYELELKNNGLLIAGLIINLVGVTFAILYIALLLMFLL